MIPNADKKDIYIIIVSNTIYSPAKGIFSTNQVCTAGHFYKNNPRKLGVKQRLVTMDVIESSMLSSDGLAYPPVRCLTDKDMDSYPKVILNPDGEWNPSDLDDDDQWEYDDDDVRSDDNVSATSYTQSKDTLEPILSAPQYKNPSGTFTDDVTFTKCATDNELFSRISEIETQKFDNYKGLYTSP